MKSLKSIIPFLFFLSMLSCKGDDFLGAFEEISVGNGTARGSMDFNEAGIPTSIGICMTGASLLDLPMFDEEYIIELPIVGNQTPFQLIGLNWNIHGHDPSGIYDLPHFDVHFYTISQPERDLITLSTRAEITIAEMSPENIHIPTDYMVGTGSSLPGMGSHWIDATAGELNGGIFDQTLIYGFYEGNMTFIEPMVTRDYLLEPKNVSFPIKQPAAYQQPGYYPTSYRVSVDDNGDICITLEDMELR